MYLAFNRVILKFNAFVLPKKSITLGTAQDLNQISPPITTFCRLPQIYPTNIYLNSSRHLHQYPSPVISIKSSSPTSVFYHFPQIFPTIIHLLPFPFHPLLSTAISHMASPSTNMYPALTIPLTSNSPTPHLCFQPDEYYATLSCSQCLALYCI